MEDRPRFQTGPREIRPSGIIGGPRETWPGCNRAPTAHTERARMVTLHLYTGAPELYPNNPTPNAAKSLNLLVHCGRLASISVQHRSYFLDRFAVRVTYDMPIDL